MELIRHLLYNKIILIICLFISIPNESSTLETSSKFNLSGAWVVSNVKLETTGTPEDIIERIISMEENRVFIFIGDSFVENVMDGKAIFRGKFFIEGDNLILTEIKKDDANAMHRYAKERIYKINFLDNDIITLKKDIEGMKLTPENTISGVMIYTLKRQ